MSNYKYLQWRGELYRKKSNRAGISFAKKFYANLNHQLENSYKADRTLNELIKDPVLKNHPWWKPYLRHHQLQIWINYLGGAKTALPYCIDTLAMLEDPIYDRFPQRHCVINDLVSVYIAMDPTGYHDKINQKITDELSIMPDDMICRACYLRDRLDMYKYGGTVTDINDVVERLLLVYASSEHFGKCQKDRLFVSASQVCLHRREIDQAKTFFSQVSTDYIDSPYRKANYQTTKSRLELALNKNNPSTTIIREVTEIIELCEQCGFNLIKQEGLKLAGDYHRLNSHGSKAVNYYVKALKMLAGTGMYHNEAETAILAAGTAFECSHPGFSYCLNRAEEANKRLKTKPFTKEIQTLRI